MDVITIAQGLATLVPGILKIVVGDKAGEVAQQVVNAAQTITGKEPQELASEISKNNEALENFKSHIDQLIVELEKVSDIIDEIQEDAKEL